MHTNNCQILCSAVTEAAQANMPSLIPQAEAIADKFHIAFQLFAKCHRVYNSSALLNDSEIDDLSKQNKIQCI